MARNVGDLGLFLNTMQGADRREPLGQPEPKRRFRDWAESPSIPKRVAYSPDFGITPVGPEVRRITEAAARRFQAMGAVVEEASPDFSGAHEAFQTLRAVAFAAGLDREYREYRAQLKPDVIWNIERGHAATGAELARAHLIRTRIVENLVALFEDFDLLLAPATIVPPFAVEDRTVTSFTWIELNTDIS